MRPIVLKLSSQRTHNMQMMQKTDEVILRKQVFPLGGFFQGNSLAE